MSLAPRSLAHAIHAHFGAPRLRVARTPRGERAMVFEPRPAPIAPRAPDPGMEADTTAPAFPDAAPSEGLGGGGRFIDDNAEVGFRSGLLRSTRDAFDLYAFNPEREAEMARLGPIERVQLDDGVEYPALRITPDVRRRVNAGGVRPRESQTQRLMFGLADGTTPEGEFRTNAQGWIHMRPYGDRWGDNRFNPDDRARSLDVLREIAGRGADFWRTAPWEDVVRAVDDIDSIVANLFYYPPDHNERVGRLAQFYDGDIERARRWSYGGDVREYVRWRDGFRRGDDDADVLLVPPEGTPIDQVRGPIERLRKTRADDIEEFSDAARAAVETLLSTRRRGVRGLLRHDTREEPRPHVGTPATEPNKRTGRFSAVARTVAALGDEWFADENGVGGRPASQVLNAIRKGRNVSREEIDNLALPSVLYGDRKVTREALMSWIEDNALRMRLQENKFDPARPTRDYELGGTRAFDGPRVPGYGRYFERRFQWPARLGKGKTARAVMAADYPHGHWDAGTWGSIRGSVREAQKFGGKGVLGEELQRDFYQKIGSGAVAEVSDAEYVRLQRLARDARDANSELSLLIRDLEMERRGVMRQAGESEPTENAAARTEWMDAIASGELLNVNRWRTMLDITERHPGLLGEHTSYAQARIRTAIQQIEALPPEALTLRTDYRSSAQNNMRHLEDQIPQMLMSDSQSTRFLVRDLFITNAKEGGAWVAIPTGALNDRIQYNTRNSAAHYYDGTLQNVLGKVARDIDPSLKVERVMLPVPPLKRGVPVYMVKGITPEMNARLRREGMPLYGAGDGGGRLRTRDDVEAGLRADPKWGATIGSLLDAGELRLIGDVDGLPAHILEAADEQGGIPSWVGAIHDRETGSTYFLTDRISDVQMRGLMVHEVGVHHGLQPMLGTRRFKAFLGEVRSMIEREEVRFQRMVDAGEMEPADRAFHPVLGPYDKVREFYGELYMGEGEAPRAKPSELTSGELEEVAAHIAENLETAFEQHPHLDTEAQRAARSWWQNLLADIKRWAVTALGIGELSPRDVHWLAIGALRRQGRQAARKAQFRDAMVAVPESRMLAYAKARGFEGEDPRAAADWLDAQGYFSPALDAARRYPQETATREQMVGWLQNQPGIKKDELNTLFLDEFVAQGGKARREEFIEWVRAHRFQTVIDMREDVYGAPDAPDGSYRIDSIRAAQSLQARRGVTGPPQYGDYTYLPMDGPQQVAARDEATGRSAFVQAPAGYFEMVIRPADEAMPGAQWRGGHFQGGLAHVRGARGRQVDGQKAAVLIEVQSDFFDARPNDFADISAALRQRGRDRALLVEHFGQQALDLFDEVRAIDRSAYLARAYNDGPNDILAIVSMIGAGGDAETRALAARVRDHNLLADDKAFAIGDQPATPESIEVDRLRTLYRNNGPGMRDSRAPFGSTWPEKAATDAIRRMIADGETRISWSTTEAVRLIAGLGSYAGDLYDARIPRLVKKWLGAEVRTGTLNDAQLRRTPEEMMQAAMDAASLAMGEAQQLRLRGEDPEAVSVLDDIAMEAFVDSPIGDAVANGRMDLFADNRMARYLEAEALRQMREWVAEAPEDHTPQDVQSYENAIYEWVWRFEREARTLAQRQSSAPQEVKVHYFDVTPEVRARALAPRSLFFGRAERFPPGFTDEKGRSVFGSRTQSLDDAIDGGGTRDYRTRGVTPADANTAVGATAAFAAANVAAGVVTSVVLNEKEREERRAEYQRLQEELAAQQESARRTAEFVAEREALQAAIADRDLEALPDMDRATLESRAAWVRDAAQWAREWTGVDPAYLQELIARETAYTFDPDVRPIRNGEALSRVLGLGQFSPKTWAFEIQRVGEQYGVDVGGRTVAQLTRDPEIQALRADPRLAIAMAAEHQAENARFMEGRLGRPITAAEAYAGHFFGRDAALRFIGGVEQDWTNAQMRQAFPTLYRRNKNGDIPNPFMERLSAREVMASFLAEFPGQSPFAAREADESD